MDQNQIMGLVVEELKRRGIEAEHEYPGYIEIPVGGTVTLKIGTANGPYAIDVCDTAGEPFESIESSIAGDSQEVQTIADFIACHTQEDL